MIPCPNCGADNMVNAIFCRQCQKKLNLDEITPEAFDDPDAKGKGSVATRIVTAVIVVLLVLIIGLLMIPVKMAASGDTVPEAEKATLDAKFAALQSSHPGKRISFTNDQATYVVTRALALPRTGDAQMLPTKISVEFLDGGLVKVVLQHKAFGKVPFCTTVVVKPTVPAAGQMEFPVQKASVGMLPFVGPMQAKAAKQISTLFENNYQFTSAKANASSVEVEADKATYVFAPK